jgi:hypothetical protein
MLIHVRRSHGVARARRRHRSLRPCVTTSASTPPSVADGCARRPRRARRRRRLHDVARGRVCACIRAVTVVQARVGDRARATRRGVPRRAPSARRLEHGRRAHACAVGCAGVRCTGGVCRCVWVPVRAGVRCTGGVCTCAAHGWGVHVCGARVGCAGVRCTGWGVQVYGARVGCAGVRCTGGVCRSVWVPVRAGACAAPACVHGRVLLAEAVAPDSARVQRCGVAAHASRAMRHGTSVAPSRRGRVVVRDPARYVGRRFCAAVGDVRVCGRARLALRAW